MTLEQNLSNLTNENLLESLLLDKQAFTLQRVGRRNMTALELWTAWLEE